MNYLYSIETKGFYIRDISSVIPDDCIELTEEEYFELLNGVNGLGKEISLVDNKLTLVEKELIIDYEELRNNLMSKIKCEYSKQLTSPVIHETFNFTGGFDSLAKLAPLYLFPGDKVIYDIDNIGRNLSFESFNILLTKINTRNQELLQTKNNLLEEASKLTNDQLTTNNFNISW